MRPGASVFPLRLIEVQGRLRSDSLPPRRGQRSFLLKAEELVLEAPGLRARVSSEAELRVLARGADALDSGAFLRAKGVSPPSVRTGGELLFYSQASDLETRPPEGFFGGLRTGLRAAFLRALDRAGGGGASSGLLVALLSGCRDGLEIEEAEAFKKAGCAHILSLSGQHLSILAAALSFLLKPLGGPRKARGAALCFCLLFVFVAGFEAALLRSLLMYGLATWASLSDRPQEARTILGLSFAIQTLLDPESARSLSFQLSYLAMFGLIVLERRFEYLLQPLSPPFLAAALSASLSAQAATIPLAAAAFGAVYPIGLIASIVSGPLVAAFLWWGLAAALLCGLIPAAAIVVAPVSRFLHDCLAASMELFARAPALDVAGGGGIVLSSLAVVLLEAFVYALPYVDYHLERWKKGRRAR